MYSLELNERLWWKKVEISIETDVWPQMFVFSTNLIQKWKEGKGKTSSKDPLQCFRIVRWSHEKNRSKKKQQLNITIHKLN